MHSGDGSLMPDDIFDINEIELTEGNDSLLVDVDGYEGPLDLLLTLSRHQKVDLRKISILALAEQYLKFVEAAKQLRIELAADYLVMAAWLAFLKSRLLLPVDADDDGPSGEELAAHLAFQLERLEAMRRCAAKLMARDQLGRDFFVRGQGEAEEKRRVVKYTANLLDLLQAYARIKTREDFEPLHLQRASIYTMEQALERMRGLIGHAVDWNELEVFLPAGWLLDPDKRRSALASTFAATLEMVKLGQLQMKQSEIFAPILLRRI